MKRSSKRGRRTVIVLGCHDTGQRVETMLAERAAECGVAIVAAHTFDRYQPGYQDDLGETESVVTALSEALRGRHDVWVPFVDDLGREEHVRRIGLVLERHGLALRVGRDLCSCPRCRGMNEIGMALRREVHAVDDLDQSVVAAAGMQSLSQEIEMELWRNDLVARRDAYERVGLYDPRLKYCEDWDMCLRLSRIGPVEFVNEVLLHYRRHGANASINVRSTHKSVRRLHYKTFFSPENSPEQREMLRAGWKAWQIFKLREKCAQAAEACLKGSIWTVLRTAAELPVHLVRFARGYPSQSGI
jgi:hypothetical protein